MSRNAGSRSGVSDVPASAETDLPIKRVSTQACHRRRKTPAKSVPGTPIARRIGARHSDRGHRKLAISPGKSVPGVNRCQARLLESASLLAFPWQQDRCLAPAEEDLKISLARIFANQFLTPWSACKQLEAPKRIL
jgi:hypothetical protein